MFNLEGNDDGSRITINGDIVMFYINKNTIGSFFNIVKNSIDNLSGLFTTQEWDSIEFLNEVIDVYIGPEFFVNECTEMVIA